MPTATVNTSLGGLIGEEVPLSVTFDNTGDAIGYSPFVDIVMPATGDAPPSPYDGISFKANTATYNGLPLTTTVLTFSSAGQATHPFAKDASGQPLVVTGKPGDQLVVVQLPFGSYGPDQPAAVINFTGIVSPLAQPNHSYNVTATGGFQFKVDGSGNPTVNEASLGATDSEPVEAQLFRIKKTSSATESETATGPNFKHTYTVSIDVAAGQTVSNLTLEDLLPDTVQFVSLSSATGNQSTSVTAVSTPSTTVPGGTLARRFDKVVGTSGSSDAQMTFSYFVPQNDRNGTPVIDLTTGGTATVVNTSSANGTWTSANPNFPTPQAVASDPLDPASRHTLTAKTTALQKSATDLTSPSSPKAGDTIQYTLNFQVSDFFALKDFFIRDVLTDGQDFDPSFTPTITYRQKSQTITGSFAPANVSSVVQANGTTNVDFNVSSQLDALGLVTDGNLLGAAIPNTGTGGPPPSANPAGPGTSGTITFRTKIRNTYRNGGGPVVQGDVISDTATSSATVLDYTNLAPTSNAVGDTSQAAVTLQSGRMTKAIYAVNGAQVSGTPSVKAGDSVTFRLTYNLPFSSIKDYTLTDFLPLPIFPAQALTLSAGSGPSAAVPAAGQWKFGPSDTYRAISGITPANPTVDSAANSLTWNFGTFEDNQNRSAVTDILFTVTASNKPFADGVLLTNQGVQAERNTDGTTLSSTGLAQVKMSEPQLAITKGVVSTNNPSGVFTPSSVAPAGVTFSPPGAPGAAFTGTITSGGLASTPINATLSNVLGNDLVRFCIIVENTGSGPNGAFDVSFRDTFDTSKMQIPSGGLNLRVTDGTGAVMGVTDLGGGIFGAGLMLNDPGPTSTPPGSLDPGKTTAGAVINNGRNIAVITYDLQLKSSVLPSDVILNTATVTNYASTEGGPNFVPNGISDGTTVTVMAPKVTKTLVGTSIPANGVDKAVIGEKATFELKVLLPPGTTTNAVVVDSMPTGLAFVQMVGSPVVDPGVTISGSTTPVVSNSNRTVTFNLGTVTNSATDRSLRGVTFRYEAVVLNVSSNVNFKTVTNSAKLTWTDHTELPAASAAPVTVIEPKLKVTKTPSRTVAQAGDVVTYTVVVAHNADSRADAHNVDLSDVIPTGLTYVPGSLANTAGLAPTTLTPPGSGGNPGNTFTATFTLLPLGQTSTFTYQARLDPTVVAGASLVNTATEKWTSLPGDPGQITDNPNAYERTGSGSTSLGQLNNYVAATTATVTVAQPTLTKSLVTTSIVNASNSATQAVIGEKATYTITVKIPQGRTPAAKLVDLMPAGLAYVQTISAVNDDPAVLTVPGLSTIPSAGNPTVATGGQTVTYDLGDIVNTDTNPATDETVTFTIEAVVLNVAANVSGVQLVNQSQVTWNNGATFTDKVSSGPVTVIEPKLQTTKSVTVGGRGGNVGDPVTYRIVVQQSSASHTDAFDVAIRDAIPSQIASPVLASVVDTGGIVTASDFSITGQVLATVPGREFDLPKLPSGRTITLTVTGTIAPGVTAGQKITNTNTATWTSLDGTPVPSPISPFNTNSVERTGSGSTAGGQLNNYKTSGSATLTINSADLAVVKTVSNASPNVGDTITFTVTVTNNGPSVANSVQITDSFPVSPELTFLSATPSQGTFTSGTGIWNVGTVGVGAANRKTLTITARVNRPTTVGAVPATLTNSATVTGVEELDPNPGNNTGTATETPKYADLGVKKTTSNVTPNTGEEITYTVSLFNLGTAAATNVQVTDALPANVQFLSATAAGGTVFTKTATGGVWNVPSIAPGQTLLLTLRVRAITTGIGYNQVTITKSDVYDPNDKNDIAKTPTNPSQADLYLTKTVNNARPNVGDTVTFTVTVQNLGPSAAANVRVNDILPSGLEYVSSSPSVGTYDDGTGVWDVTSSLASGTTQTLEVRARVKNPGSGPALAQKNTATATTTTTDPDPQNNTDDVTVTPKQADVAITKIVSDPTPKVGDTITFTLTVANYGSDTATNVVATDVLPAGLTFVSATASQGSYNNGSGIWTVGTVSSSTFPTLVIRARVASPTPGTTPSTATNTATVTATEYDPDPSNNTSSVTETPQYADLAVEKTVDNAAPNVGDVIAFTITLDNLGADSAGGVTVLDRLPSGLQFVSASPSQGTYDAATGIWTVGTVDTLFSRTLVIRARVLAPAAGGIPPMQTNIASVRTSDQYDPDTSNNSDSVTETPQYADLDVDKVVSNDKPKLGETVTFTITLSNQGVDDATGVTIADKLPTGLSFVSATPAAGTSYDPVTGTWDVGTLSNGASIVLTIDAIVNTVFTVTNIASVNTVNQYDPDTSNNSDGATIDPQASFIVVGPDLGCDLGIESRAIRVIDPVTGVEWTRFFPFGSDFRGGVSIATADLLGTGEPVIVVGSGRGRPGEVRVFTQNGVELPAYRTQPYGSGYTLGVNVAAGDITGDGKPDIVTSQALGPVTVRGFAVDPSAADPVRNAPVVSFAPFGGAFGAGATVATADLVPGGPQEILVGTGAGVRAQVRVFGGAGSSQLLKTILPFDNTFTGGVSVATGRINADTIPDVIIGAGNGGNGGSRVEIWDGAVAANAKLAAFAAFADSRKPNAAVFASSFDTDGDGIDDRLAVVQGAGGVTDEVREFVLSDTSTAPSPFPYKATLSQQLRQKAPMRVTTLRR